jgi:hypothetical protein
MIKFKFFLGLTFEVQSFSPANVVYINALLSTEGTYFAIDGKSKQGK